MSALSRRLVSVPRMVALYLVLWITAPVLFPIAAVIDVIRYLVSRTPFTTTRLLAFGLVYTASEMVGMTVLLFAPLFAGGTREGILAQTYRIQAAWAGTLLRAAEVLFRLRFEVEGLDALRPGPLVLFMRHASIVDTLIPTVLLARPTGLRLRFVLKRELLALPCLDIAGHRLPNCFVARGGEDTEREIGRVRDLAKGLGERDAVIIYPEGTRFSEKKRARALEKLAERAPERHARLRSLAHLLPVRSGGSLALFDADPEADIVMIAHAGLEAFAELVDVWRGKMVGRTIRLSLTRHPRRGLPAEAADRLTWLDQRWLEMDAWIAARE